MFLLHQELQNSLKNAPKQHVPSKEVKVLKWKAASKCRASSPCEEWWWISEWCKVLGRDCSQGTLPVAKDGGFWSWCLFAVFRTSKSSEEIELPSEWPEKTLAWKCQIENTVGHVGSNFQDTLATAQTWKKIVELQGQFSILQPGQKLQLISQHLRLLWIAMWAMGWLHC